MGTGYSSERISETAPPSPPMILWFSAVTIALHSEATLIISSG